MNFDKLYQELPSSEFFKLNDLLQTHANVELVSTAIHVCVLEDVRESPLVSRLKTATGPLVQYYHIFTNEQLQTMIDTITDMKSKYSAPAYANQTLPADLVHILDSYYDDLVAELIFQQGGQPQHNCVNMSTRQMILQTFIFLNLKSNATSAFNQGHKEGRTFFIFIPCYR